MKILFPVMRLALAFLVFTIFVSGCAQVKQPDPFQPIPNNLPLATIPPFPTLEQPLKVPAGSQVKPTISLVATPEPTLPPIATSTSKPALDPDCLVGSWEVRNLDQAMGESLRKSDSSLAIERVEGQSLYTFDADHQMKLTFDNLAVTLNGTVDQRQVTAVESLSGSGTALYAIDTQEGTLTLSDFGGDGIRFGLDINGQRLAEGNLQVWQALPSGLPENQPGSSQTPEIHSTLTKVLCGGNQLTMQEQEPTSGPRVELERVP